MALSAKLYLATEPGERRAAPRRSVGHGTTLRLSGLPLDVVLHDLSETGASIETDMSMADGATVTIGLAGVGRFEARLVSRNGARYGCRFLTPLSANEAASAFRTNPIITGPFIAAAPLPSQALAEQAKWPGAIRVALPTGIALGGWIAVIQFARRMMGW